MPKGHAGRSRSVSLWDLGVACALRSASGAGDTKFKIFEENSRAVAWRKTVLELKENPVAKDWAAFSLLSCEMQTRVDHHIFLSSPFEAPSVDTLLP